MNFDLDSWLANKEDGRPVLILGPSLSGKTTAIRELLERHKDTHHEIALACPERGISPVVYMQKRLLMKDVMCLFSEPIYTLDSLDTMIAGEKSVITDFVKILKSGGAIARKKLIIIASTGVEKKVTELKKLCHIVRKEGGNALTGADQFSYTFHDALAAGPSRLTRYFSNDPWLTVLGAVEPLDAHIGPKNHGEFLDGFMTWGELISASGDDFFHEESAQFATTFMSYYVAWLASTSVKKQKGKQVAEEGGGQFTHLLTLHSIRKRNWTEKYESGLPWFQDPYNRLGSKFSENTIDGLWKAL